MVDTFYHIALEYCRWAESKESSVLVALRILSSLYQQAILLPDIEMDEDFPIFTVDKVILRQIYERFGVLPFNYYSHVFHPFALTTPLEEPTIGDIADDLMDIYNDIKEGIQLYESHYIQQAIFHWKTTFGWHWGKHLVDAIRVLHLYEFGEK